MGRVTQSDSDRHSELPARGDGGEWRNHMLIVAQQRALGKNWEQSAEAASLKSGTVRNYPSRYPGWDALVEHYRQQAFSEGVRDHFLSGSVEALDALRHEVRDAAQKLREMEQRADDGELDPDEASAAVDLSRAVAYAADKYLSALGFKKYRERVAELRAEMEVQGKTGQTLHHEVEGVDEVEWDELTDDELEERIVELEQIVTDE